MYRNIKVIVVLVIILLPFFTFVNLKAATAQQTSLNVVNPLTGDQWFNFTTLQKNVGDIFTMNITVANVANLGSFQLTLQWNSSLLTFVSASLPSDNVFAGQNPVIAGPDTSTAGQVTIGAAAGPSQPGFSGSGRLVQVVLRIVQSGGQCPISFEGVPSDTFLTALNLANIPFTPVNGYYAYPVGPSIINVFRTPSVPNYDETVQVEAVVSDSGEVASIFVLYNYGNSTIYVNMNYIGGNNFDASIPPLPFNTTVSYRIFVMDTSQNWIESSLYSYTVGDFVPPNIASLNWKPTCPFPYIPSNRTRAYEPTLVTANVSEPNNASGVATVLFSYRANHGQWWNTTMDFNATSGLYTTQVLGLPGNCTVDLFVVALDKAGNMNPSGIYTFTVLDLRPGDVNGDGVVNMRDIAYLVLHFNEKTFELAVLNFNQHE